MPHPYCRLLDPTNMLQFDDFKKCYGEILYRWGLREKRADVLKFASCAPEPHKGIGMFTVLTVVTWVIQQWLVGGCSRLLEKLRFFCISHAHSKYLANHIIVNSAWIKCPEQTARALKPGLPERNEVILIPADAGAHG